MVKILVLGYGRMGYTIVKDLISNNVVSSIGVCDYNYELIKSLKNEKVESFYCDVRDESSLIKIMREYDVAISALPSYLGFKAETAAIEAGVNMVDISYMSENPLTLDSMARDADVTIIPDCGVAPGLSNMLIGYNYDIFDQVRSIKILVGSLPQNPVPSLDYVITWSAEDLLEEYIRPVRIIENGVLKYVEPLTGIELVNFEGIGVFEAFYTDGLRTLLRTLGGKVLEMGEKTLRYPGHAEKIRFLKKLGFLDDEPLDMGNVKVKPRKFLAKLLDEKLRSTDPDMLLLRVILRGVKNSSSITKIIQVIDFYDKEKNLTALSRTTGYTATGTALLVAKKIIKERGVLPPELIGFNQMFMNHLLNYLSERKICVQETEHLD